MQKTFKRLKPHAINDEGLKNQKFNLLIQGFRNYNFSFCYKKTIAFSNSFMRWFNIKKSFLAGAGIHLLRYDCYNKYDADSQIVLSKSQLTDLAAKVLHNAKEGGLLLNETLEEST